MREAIVTQPCSQHASAANGVLCHRAGSGFEVGAVSADEPCEAAVRFHY